MAAGSDRESRNAPDAAAAATGRLTPITNMVKNNLVIFVVTSFLSLSKAEGLNALLSSGKDFPCFSSPRVLLVESQIDFLQSRHINLYAS
jgi:hypothetical protein